MTKVGAPLRRLVVAIAACAPTVLVAQPKAASRGDVWRDPADHKSGFVPISKDVQLHYLDFGGTGPSILMIPGLGNTAHAFDDFAPAFTDRFHVVAMTRRGFGESSHPSDGYDIKTLVDDIRTVIDRLHLGRVILIGHSIAGEEMTQLAAQYPDQVSKLVYLDAAYDRVAADSMIDEVFPVMPEVAPRPEPTAADTATPDAYVQFVHRTRGVNIPESDIRTRYKYDGWNEEITTAYQSIGTQHPPYKQVRAPALAIYAVADTVTQLEPWQRADTEHASAQQDLIRGIESVERKLRLQFRDEVPLGSILEIHGGHHWIFVSHRDEVVSAVRKFLLTSSS
jgi:pimeloyl-ACP methyl ester carboxylesterase